MTCKNCGLVLSDRMVDGGANSNLVTFTGSLSFAGSLAVRTRPTSIGGQGKRPRLHYGMASGTPSIRQRRIDTAAERLRELINRLSCGRNLDCLLDMAIYLFVLCFDTYVTKPIVNMDAYNLFEKVQDRVCITLLKKSADMQKIHLEYDAFVRTCSQAVFASNVNNEVRRMEKLGNEVYQFAVAANPSLQKKHEHVLTCQKDGIIEKNVSAQINVDLSFINLQAYNKAQVATFVNEVSERMNGGNRCCTQSDVVVRTFSSTSAKIKIMMAIYFVLCKLFPEQCPDGILCKKVNELMRIVAEKTLNKSSVQTMVGLIEKLKKNAASCNRSLYDVERMLFTPKFLEFTPAVESDDNDD